MTPAAAEALKALAAFAIAYLLGSVLPADQLARVRGIEIRSVGDGNPGTVNAFKGLGWLEGAVTLVYDFSVGIVSVRIALLMGLPDGIAYLAGLTAVVGHRFPAFRGFRGGGQGMAASAGLLVYGVVVAATSGWLSVGDFALLAVVAAVTFVLTRSDILLGLIVLPVLVIELAAGRPDWRLLAFVAATAAHIWITQVMVVRRTTGFRSLTPAGGHPHR